MAVRPYEREEMGLVCDILYLHLVSKEYVPNNVNPINMAIPQMCQVPSPSLSEWQAKRLELS